MATLEELFADPLAKAQNASDIAEQWANGDNTTVIATTGGDLPSLAKFMYDNVGAGSFSELEVDLSTGDVTLTTEQTADNAYFKTIGNAIPRELTLQATPKLLYLENAGSDVLTITVGTTSIVSDPNHVSILYTDGTANGLIELVEQNVKNNTDSIDPTINNDDSEGYTIHSTWVNTSSEEIFYCTDASTAAAVWKNITDALTLGGITASQFLRSDQDTTANGILTVGGTSVAGDEGGEVRLTKAPNSTLSGSHATVDNFIDTIRIFEDGGTSRGVYLDLTECSPAVASKLYHTGNDSNLAKKNIDNLFSESQTISKNDTVVSMSVQNTSTTGTDYSLIQALANSKTTSLIQYASGDSYLYNAEAGVSFNIGTSSTSDLNLYSNNVTALTVKSNQDIAIGASAALNGFRNLDVTNTSTAAATDGARSRLTSADVAGTGSSSFSFLKQKNGAASISNTETDSAANITMAIGGNTLLGLGSDGTLDLNKGLIKFPATQIGSTDANTLDDYEEGTFTPVVYGTTTAGTPVYVDRAGTYTKIGDMVHCQLYIDLSSGGGMVGDIRISGLPFNTKIITTGGAAAVTIGNVGGLNITTGYSLSGRIVSATSVIALYLSDSTSGNTALQNTEITNNFTIDCSFTYKVA